MSTTTKRYQALQCREGRRLRTLALRTAWFPEASLDRPRTLEPRLCRVYTAYKLQQKNPKLSLLLLEKNDYFGGRIYTVHHKDLVFEAGAGRFNETHTRVHKLIDELGLKSKIAPIPSDLHFVPSGPYPAKYFDKDPFQIMTPVLQEAKKTPRQTLREQTFIQYARKRLSKEDSRFLEDAFWYYEQLMEMNAFDAVKLFDKGMHTRHTFFRVARWNESNHR